MKKSACLLLCLWTFNANATAILYDISNIAGNRWEYTYDINNNSLAGDIEEFTIFFDFNLYGNLAVGLTPADWDPLIIQPDTGLPDDGFYDALALVTGIAPGNSLGGFSVTFDYLGTGTPGNQEFEIINPDTFETIDSGVATPPSFVVEGNIVQPVPTLSEWSIILLSSLIAWLALTRQREIKISVDN